MALTDAELSALDSLRHLPPAPTSPGRTEEIPPDVAAMVEEPAVTDLFSLLENNLYEMNYLIDEIVTHPDLRDTNVLTFMGNLKGRLLTMGRDFNEVKRGTYRAEEQEPIRTEESYFMPQVGPGESLAVRKPLPPGESYASPMAQRLFV